MKRAKDRTLSKICSSERNAGKEPRPSRNNFMEGGKMPQTLRKGRCEGGSAGMQHLPDNRVMPFHQGRWLPTVSRLPQVPGGCAVVFLFIKIKRRFDYV